MGIAVQMTTKGRPTARVVVLDGDWATPSTVEAFELTSTDDDKPLQLAALAAGLRSRVKGLTPDRIVIRRADLQVASKKEGPRVRLLAEGALAASAREEVDEVLLLTGKDLAAKSPAASKADMDTHAKSVLPGTPVEAAAAALVGLLP
jgi:hypothetical protein